MRTKVPGRRSAATLVILTMLGGAVALLPESSAASADGLFAQAQARQAPSARPGQVIHVVIRSYERHAPTVVDGPLHLDAALLSPETQVIGMWVIVGERGRIARAVTYTTDATGDLIRQTVVDAAGHAISEEVRQGTTLTGGVSEPGSVDDVAGQGASLSEARALRRPQATREDTTDGRTTVTLEYRSQADPAWLREAADGALALRGQRVQTLGQRLTFDKETGALMKDTHFAITDRGEEHVLRSKQWEPFEVLDPAQVPAGTFSPALSAPASDFTAVPIRQLSDEHVAAATLPFPLYTLDRAGSSLPVPRVTYSTGQRVDLMTLPVRYRGLDFAVQRGEATNILYEAVPPRYLALVEGSSVAFADALRHALPFWASAKPLAATIDGTPAGGWFLTSAPIATTDPTLRSPQQAPGPDWVLLPNVRGTGVLMIGQDYSEAELVALTARLRRQS